ncbi:hypothetical protein DIPPA_10556 [Diplonema papillatum]|nr:hypothetical protein DIPPA_10556 [Diplonema papillatum]
MVFVLPRPKLTRGARKEQKEEKMRQKAMHALFASFNEDDSQEAVFTATTKAESAHRKSDSEMSDGDDITPDPMFDIAIEEEPFEPVPPLKKRRSTDSSGSAQSGRSNSSTEVYEDPLQDAGFCDLAPARGRTSLAAQFGGHDLLIAGIGKDCEIDCRQKCMLQILELVVQDPMKAKEFRHDVNDLFEITAELDPAESAAVSALWRVALLVCTKIATTPYNTTLLSPSSWNALGDMLRVALGKKSRSPEQEQSTARGGSIKRKPLGRGVGRNVTLQANRSNADRFLQRHKQSLVALSKRVAEQVDSGPEAPGAMPLQEETSVSLLLNCVICMVLNSDRSVLLRLMESSHPATTVNNRAGKRKRTVGSFAKRKPNGDAQLPASDEPPLLRIRCSSPFVQWLVDSSCLQLVLDLLAPDNSLTMLPPLVALRALYLLQLVSLYSEPLGVLVKTLLLPTLSVIKQAVPFAERHTFYHSCVSRCLHILIQILPTPEAAHSCFCTHAGYNLGKEHCSDLLTAVHTVLLRDMCEKSAESSQDSSDKLSPPDQQIDDRHDYIVIALNLAANIVDACHSTSLCNSRCHPASGTSSSQEPEEDPGKQTDTLGHVAAADIIDVGALVRHFQSLRQSDRTDNLVLAAYASMLLSVVSLTSETRRLSICKELLEANVSSDDKPIRLLCATLQEFIIFQSDALVLTPYACFRMQTLSEQVMRANDLTATTVLPAAPASAK